MHTIIVTARIVCGARSMQLSGVRPSVCPIRPLRLLLQVCCCGPGKQEIWIDCCPAHSSSSAAAQHAAANAGSAT